MGRPVISEAVSRVIGTSVGNSEVIAMGGFCGAVLGVPASNGNTTLTFYHSFTENGTFVPLVDNAGAAVSLTIDASAAQHYEFPDAANVGNWLKIVAGTAQFTAEWAGKTL